MGAMTYSHVCGVVPSLTGLYDRRTGYGVSGFRHDWIFGKWDRTVYAHELGHAIGGPHTHEMNPPIDTCGSSTTRCPYRQGQGTIMSYCNACTGGLMNTRYEFHPRIVRAIHSAYNFYQRRGRSPMQTVSQCLQFNRHIPDNGLSFVLFGGSTCISEGIDYSACGNSCRVNTCNNDAFWYWDASSSNVRSGKEADYCWQTDNACSGISLQRCSNSGSQRFQISSQGIRSNQCGLVRFSGNRISFNSNNAIVRDYCLKGGNPTGLNVEGCVISEAERNWRLWPRRLPRTCEEADVLHQACTMDLPFSHEVRENCPATCAMARQEPCPNGSTGGDSGPGDGPSGPGNGPSSECEPISCNQRATGTTRGSRAGTKCFTFEASQTSPIRFSTCGSQFDTMLDIQSGGLRVISGDDEGDCGTRTILPVDAVAGSDYTIILTGFAGQTGNYVLEAQCPDFGDSDSSDDGPAADRYVAPSGCTCISVQHPSWGRIDSCTTPAGSGFAPFCYVTGTCAQQESGSVPGRFWADCVLDDDSSDVVDDSSDAGSDYFRMTGDCEVQGNYVSSANYPGRHGNRESCSVTMLRSASLTVSSTFNLETCCDHLMIRGVDTESSGAVPASLNSGETFTWTTDFSVTRAGWQICFSDTTQTSAVETTTTSSPSWDPTSDPTMPLTDEPTNTPTVYPTSDPTEEPTEEDTCGDKVCDFGEMTSCPGDCEDELIEAICDCAKVSDMCNGTCADVGSLDPLLFPECSTYAAAGICGGVLPMEISYMDMCPDQCEADETTSGPTEEGICGDKVCNFGELTSCPEDCETELMDAICDCAKVADICDGTCADVASLDPVMYPECSTYAVAGICGAVVPMEMSYMDMCPDQCSDDETTFKPDWSTEEPTEENMCGNKLCDFGEMTSCPEDCEAELIEAICDCVKVAEICDGTCADVGSLDPVQFPECSTYAAVGICGGVIPMDMPYTSMCESQCPTDPPTLTPTMSPSMNPTKTPTMSPTILPTEDSNAGLVAPPGCSCVRTEHPTWDVIDSCMVPAGTNFAPFCYVSGSCASQPSSSVPGSRWADCVQNDGSGSGLSVQCGSSVSGSTRGRVSEVGHSSGDYSYEFTPQSSTSVTFDLCDSEFDTYLRIFQGSGNEVARNDDHGGRCGSGSNRLASHVETTVLAGLTYTVVVEGYRRSEGNFQLDVTCADSGNGGGNGGDNDNTIACGRTVSGTTVGRSSIVGNNAGEAVFEFVATESEYEFDACLSGYDSVIRVYEGAAANLSRTSRQIAMNDDHSGRCSGSNRFASHIRRARTTIGQTYTLVVEGYGSNEGNFVVTANCS